MRIISSVATAVCLSVLAAAAVFMAAPSAAAADASAAAKPSAMTPAAAAANDAAAKKHAKRTACLNDAKSRKLIGADKTSFLNSCIAVP